jgi:hypothetical protein
MSPELLRYFDRFGRSLRDGERIEFPLPEGGETSLTPAVRERLLVASQAEEWTREATLKGRVSAVSQSDEFFELEQRNGNRLKARFERQHVKTILDALAQYRDGTVFAVKGIIRIDKNGRPKAFESVEYINQLDPLDIETRLEDLGQLKAGWLDGKGRAPDRDALESLARQFDAFFDSELPLPHLYPTAEGGIQAEWSQGDWEISLDIQLPGQAAEYQALNVSTDECFEMNLNLSEGERAWARVNDHIRSLSGSGLSA